MCFSYVCLIYIFFIAERGIVCIAVPLCVFYVSIIYEGNLHKRALNVVYGMYEVKYHYICITKTQ